MLDIITVVFRDELPVLKLQAESIELYCRDMTLGNIVIVINDDSMTKEDIDPAWYGEVAGLVKIIHRQELADYWTDNGWLTQQLCKLLAGAGITFSKWTMVLDAKTILIQPVLRERLFDESRRLTWGHLPIFPVFAPAKEIVSKLFGIEQRNVIGPAGIPFFFDNRLLRNMIQEVERRTGTNFARWFQETGMVTEFILYSGYVQYCDGTLDQQYTNTFSNRYFVCNICHSEVEQFDSKFLQMSNKNNLTVSIHRNAWSKLTNSQRKNYQDFLLSKGITRAQNLL
jgi:hypothetical protein